MLKLYILGIGLVIALIVYLIRIINVFFKEREPLMSPALITVVRRESSGLNTFTVWEVYLNGVNIGRIDDCKSITAATGRRYNELTAKGPKGAQSPLHNFTVGSGSDWEIWFKEGKFVNEHKTDMPAGESELPAVYNAKPVTGCAQITVVRWEESGLKSFAARCIYLNGVNIGDIKNGGSKTVAVSQRNNVLTAEGFNGAVTPYFRFSVKRGWHSEVRLTGGRFGGAHRTGKLSLARREDPAVRDTLH